MTTLLIGHWDHGGNLIVDESHCVDPNDQATIDALVGDLEDLTTSRMSWAATFDTDDHKRAIQQAYETYVRYEETELIDEAEHVQPDMEEA